MSAWLDSSRLRGAAYLLVALLAVVAGWRERRHHTAADRLWPAYWFMTAVLFAVIAAGRAGDLASLLGDLGRAAARGEGWYDGRRAVQATAVLAVGVGWSITVLLAIWRVPERRRRYLPTALVTLTILCFAAVRFISLHHIDAVLHRRAVGGVQLGNATELTLVVVAIALTGWHACRQVPPVRAAGAGTSSPRAVRLPPNLSGRVR